MKVAVIGGGSTYTPELVEGFILKAERLGLTELTLMDIDADRLLIVGDFVKRMAAHAGNPFKVTTTANRTEALEGATFVNTQFRVGQQPARHQDILLGLRHDLIGQETTGIGGMAKALRTIPVIVDICEDIDRVAPDAWLINFTNPSGLITECILNYTNREKCIGLCNVPLEAKMVVAKHLNVPEEDIDMDVVGLNHLGWVRQIKVNGQDISEQLLAMLAQTDGPANIPDMDYQPELIRALKSMPLYYNRFYYNTERVLAELRAKPKTRAQEVMEIEKKLLTKYMNPELVTKPPELELRGGAYYSKIAIEVMDAIVNDLNLVHVVNTRNEGAIPGLPDEVVVETVATIGKNGATPRATFELDPSMLALIQRAKAYEILTIKAALKQSYDFAFKAIFTNPLGPTADNAKEVLEDMLETNNLNYK